MKKKALVILISVITILLVFSSSISNPVAAERETTTKRVPARVSKPAQIRDRRTGQIVGYVDPKTKDLIFTNRKIKIPRSGITRVSKEEYELLRQHYGLAPAGTMKPRMVKHLNVFLPAPHIGGIGGGGGGGGVEVAAVVAAHAGISQKAGQCAKAAV